MLVMVSIVGDGTSSKYGIVDDETNVFELFNGEELKESIASDKISIENLDVGVTGNLVITNGKAESYKNKSITIICKVRGGYEVGYTNGDIKKLTDIEVVAEASKFGITNGKMVKKNNRTYILSLKDSFYVKSTRLSDLLESDYIKVVSFEDELSVSSKLKLECISSKIDSKIKNLRRTEVKRGSIANIAGMASVVGIGSTINSMVVEVDNKRAVRVESMCMGVKNAASKLMGLAKMEELNGVRVGDEAKKYMLEASEICKGYKRSELDYCDAVRKLDDINTYLKGLRSTHYNIVSKI